jgi:hypothetical protein
MSALRLTALSAVLALGAVACGSDKVTYVDRPTPVPAPAPTLPSNAVPATSATGSSRATTPPTTATSEMRVTNGFASTSIGTLQVSPSSRNSWGVNQLDAPLRPGASITLWGLPCDAYYDVRLKNTSGTVLAEERQIYVDCDYMADLIAEY